MINRSKIRIESQSNRKLGCDILPEGDENAVRQTFQHTSSCNPPDSAPWSSFPLSVAGFVMVSIWMLASDGLPLVIVCGQALSIDPFLVQYFAFWVSV